MNTVTLGNLYACYNIQRWSFENKIVILHTSIKRQLDIVYKLFKIARRTYRLIGIENLHRATLSTYAID